MEGGIGEDRGYSVYGGTDVDGRVGRGGRKVSVFDPFPAARPPHALGGVEGGEGWVR